MKFRFGLAVILACYAGSAGSAPLEPFRFQDLERYYLYVYRPLNLGDPAQAQLEKYAMQYARERFPLGSSASIAVSTLEEAGAKCMMGNDPLDPPAFVCDWSRPDYGLDYLCCEIDWIVLVITDNSHSKVLDFRASRTESGP